MRQRNPADVVLRTRYRQTVLFPDLTERLSLRLSSIVTYTARAHFALWHRKMGGPDFTNPTGVFTPLVVVELEAADVPVEPWQPFLVRGETYLAKVLDGNGDVRHLVREGRHTVLDVRGTEVARKPRCNFPAHRNAWYRPPPVHPPPHRAPGGNMKRPRSSIRNMPPSRRAS